MNKKDIASAVALQLIDSHLRLLEVCLEHHTRTHGMFCGEWIKNTCESRAIPFHQSWLIKLANVGLFEKLDASRREHRRYYRIVDVGLVQAVLGHARASR
jgi:hypothetical protein